MKSRMLRGPAGDVLLAGKIRLCRMCRRHSDVQKEGWYEYGSRMQHICMGYHGEAGRVPKYSKYGVACIHDPQCRQVFGQVSQEQQKCDVTDLGAYRTWSLRGPFLALSV